MEQGAEAKRIPPYVPFRTFMGFIDSLRNVVIPTHLDNAVMPSMSGGMRSWLRNALRTMDLMDRESRPTERLERLVKSEGDDRKAVLRDLFNTTYAPLLKGKIDLTRTTQTQLRTVLTDVGAQGETVTKAMAFLLAFAKEAGFELSPHLGKRANQRRPRAQRAPKATASNQEPLPLASPDNNAPARNGMDDDITRTLIGKFPTFDSNWPPEVQAKWFDNFEKLMKAAKG